MGTMTSSPTFSFLFLRTLRASRSLISCLVVSASFAMIVLVTLTVSSPVLKLRLATASRY